MNQNQLFEGAKQTLIYVVVQILIVALVYAISFHSDAVQVYAEICAWWVALYVSRVFALPVLVFGTAFIVAFAIGVTAVLMQWGHYIFHDVAFDLDSQSISLIASNALFFASPILVDNAIRKIETKLRAKF